jgi:hypothetical protein
LYNWQKPSIELCHSGGEDSSLLRFAQERRQANRRIAITAAMLAPRQPLPWRWGGASMELDDQALDRIIAAAGGKSVPDRAALCSDLVAAVTEHHIRSNFGSPKIAKERIERLKMIRTRAKQLALLLKADDDDWGLVRRLWPAEDGSPLARTKFLVEQIDQIDLLQGLPRDAIRRTEHRFGITGSPFAWLVGGRLTELLKKHFGIEATFHRNDGVPAGAFIGFAEQVLVEFQITNDGKPYELESVARALTDARAGRDRRKGQS